MLDPSLQPYLWLWGIVETVAAATGPVTLQSLPLSGAAAARPFCPLPAGSAWARLAFCFQAHALQLSQMPRPLAPAFKEGSGALAEDNRLLCA